MGTQRGSGDKQWKIEENKQVEIEEPTHLMATFRFIYCFGEREMKETMFWGEKENKFLFKDQLFKRPFIDDHAIIQKINFLTKKIIL